MEGLESEKGPKAHSHFFLKILRFILMRFIYYRGINLAMITNSLKFAKISTRLQ